MAMQENPDQITYFAQTNSRGKEAPFGIRNEDRARSGGSQLLLPPGIR